MGPSRMDAGCGNVSPTQRGVTGDRHLHGAEGTCCAHPVLGTGLWWLLVGATVTLSGVMVAPGDCLDEKSGGHPADARPHPCGFQDAQSCGKQSPSPYVSLSIALSLSVTPSVSPSPLLCAPPWGQPSCFAFTFLFLPYAPPGTGRWLSAEATGLLPGHGCCYKSTGTGEGQRIGAGNLQVSLEGLGLGGETGSVGSSPSPHLRMLLPGRILPGSRGAWSRGWRWVLMFG